MMTRSVGLGLVAQQGEGAGQRLVGGDLVLLDPGAIDVAEEVVLSADGGVEGRAVDAGDGAERGFSPGDGRAEPTRRRKRGEANQGCDA